MRRYIFILCITSLLLSCGPSDTKQKELELKDRELALKEKELALKEKDSTGNQVKIATTEKTNTKTTPDSSSLIQSGECLTVKEAENLIQESARPITYVLEESERYGEQSVSEVLRDNPMRSLLYQKGYIKFEDNGVYIFGFITSKGRELMLQYPNGITLSSQPSFSVTRVKCVGKKASVTVSVKAKPSQSAISLLGMGISKVHLFGTPRKGILNLNFRNGKWKLQVEDLNLFYLNTLSHFN